MKLSIITINRNNAAGLRKTIESVVSQTYTDFEYIIIDGASTDGSVEVIKDHSEKISYWVSEPDTGIYNAMNKGILKANGDYLLFLNSGDWLVDKEVLDLVFSKSTIEDIIYGNSIQINDEGQFSNCWPSTDNLSAYQLITNSIPHNASFIRKALFEKYGNYDESLKIVSDWKFFFEMIVIHEVNIKYFDINISFFDLNGISNTMNNLAKQERDHVLLEFLPKKVIKDYEYAYNEIVDFDKRKKSLDKDVHLISMNKVIRRHWLTRKLQTGLFYLVKKMNK